MAQDKTIDEKLYEDYGRFQNSAIQHRRFTQKDIQKILDELSSIPKLKVTRLGKSIEGRPISMVSFGKGKTQVLLWSQMHGNEPTATMAIMDILQFLTNSYEYADCEKFLEKEITIHFIPMLNPDGAEKFQRRNALGIDLNRDALRLQCPESKILKRVRDSLNADWGFNLHDQNRYYGAGRNPKTASISFLAPAYNYEKEVNTSRANSMKLIGVMNDILQKHIPNQVGRYSDDFEPRAFGDNIQKWGTSTILIESGAIKNDREKQYLRKLHFVIILSALHAIADYSFSKMELDNYESIPFNKSNHFDDLIIRNAQVVKNSQSFTIDIAFRNEEKEMPADSDFYFQSRIRDIGDLSVYQSYEEFDASTFEIVPGKVFPKKIKNSKQLSNLKIIDLLKEGYTQLVVEDLPSPRHTRQLPLTFHLKNNLPSNAIEIDGNPNLVFKKDGKVHFVLVNGFLFDVAKNSGRRTQPNWNWFLNQIKR